MLAPLLLCSLPVWQDIGDRPPEARRRVYGRVTDAAGKPWAGVPVHLLARPIGARADTGEPDHVVIQTDERGRFRARIVPGLDYAVWAAEGAWGAKGRRLTAVVEGVRPMSPVRLHEAGPRPAVKVDVQGIDQWSDLGPLEFRLVWPTRSVRLVPLRLEEGVLVVPPQPVSFFALEAVTAEGETFASRILEESDIARGRLRWKLPAAREQTFEVVRSPGGDPVAGATVWLKLAEYGPFRSAWSKATGLDSRWLRIVYGDPRTLWVKLGVTGDDGRARVRVPETGTEVVVTAAGSELGWARQSKQTRFEIEDGMTIRGRVTFGDRPASGLRLLVRHRHQVRYKRGTRTVQFRPPVLETAADGSFELSTVRAESAVRLEAVPEPSVVALAGHRDVAPARIVLANLETGKGSVHDVGPIDVAKLASVEVEVVDPDGQPSRGPFLVLRYDWGRATAPHDVGRPIALRAGRRGRAVLLLPHGRYHVLAVADPGGHATRSFSTAELAGRPLRIALEPYRRVRVRVVDLDGGPVAGARIGTSGGSYTHLDHMYAEVFAWNSGLLTGTTGAKGLFRFQLIPWPRQTYSIAVSLRSGAKTVHGRDRVRLSSQDPPEEIELVLPVRRSKPDVGK